MKKQAIAIAIASALVSPSAFAAQDTSGMQFTSASEGFYASLRARLDFSSGDNDANISASSSRVGIRGSNDLGGGLSGFYQWEAGVNIDNGSSLGSVRLGHVGLRGGFGEMVVGSFWTNDYNWTHGSTDVANTNSGYLNYNDERSARGNKAIQYTTPDLNGFQGAIRVQAGGDNDDNDLDSWNLAGVYAIQGFTVAGSYNSVADGVNGDYINSAISAANGITDSDRINFAVDAVGATNGVNATPGVDSGVDGVAANAGNVAPADLDSWTLRLGYAQDNWYVNGWYGEDGASEASVAVANTTAATNGAASFNLLDAERFSIAGGITLDKVHLYALYEQVESGIASTGFTSPLLSGTRADSYGTVGVQYDLGAQSRVWIEYFSRDLESDTSADDVVGIGLRHDF